MTIYEIRVNKWLELNIWDCCINYLSLCIILDNYLHTILISICTTHFNLIVVSSMRKHIQYKINLYTFLIPILHRVNTLTHLFVWFQLSYCSLGNNSLPWTITVHHPMMSLWTDVINLPPDKHVCSVDMLWLKFSPYPLGSNLLWHTFDPISVTFECGSPLITCASMWLSWLNFLPVLCQWTVRAPY